MSRTARLLASAAAVYLGMRAALDLSPWAFVHLMYAVVLYPRTPTS
ncbi:hypothetical protein [Streptomyces cinereoruber]